MHPFQFADGMQTPQRTVSFYILQCVLLATDELIPTECNYQDMLHTQCGSKVRVICYVQVIRTDSRKML